MKLIILYLICLLPSSLLASDWMLSEGASTLSAGIGYSTADSYWDKNSELQQDNCSSHDTALSLRYEHGYSYYHTIFTSAAFEKSKCGSNSASGIPDIKLGIRGRMNPYRNSYSWELAAIIPLQGDRFDRSKPGKGVFGLEAGLYRSYRDDPYEKPFTAIKDGLWSWGLGVNLWAQNTGHQLWGKIGWAHPINNTWSFGAQLLGRKAIFTPDQEISGLFGSNKNVDYDVINLSAKISHKLGHDYNLSVYLQQALWGRNAANDTSLQLALHKFWD